MMPVSPRGITNIITNYAESLNWAQTEYGVGHLLEQHWRQARHYAAPAGA